MKYTFVQLDPRPIGTGANEAVFAGASAGVFGVEVTVPALAALCVVNLDHHGIGDTAETPSASEQALTCGIPPEGAVLATIRSDADSVTAMAILSNRSESLAVDAGLVHAIGCFDRLGPSAGKSPATVSAIARKATDFKLSLEARVQWISQVLAGDGKEAEVEQLVSAHGREIEDARKASEVTLQEDGRLVTVVSKHRFATNLGYEVAQVVVAQNPAMSVDPKDPAKGTYRKYTVCRYDSHVKCDLQTALAELQSLEPGWGGRGDIFGSPQGVSSTLTLDQVVKVINRHFK